MFKKLKSNVKAAMRSGTSNSTSNGNASATSNYNASLVNPYDPTDHLLLAGYFNPTTDGSCDNNTFEIGEEDESLPLFDPYLDELEQVEFDASDKGTSRSMMESLNTAVVRTEEDDHRSTNDVTSSIRDGIKSNSVFENSILSSKDTGCTAP